MFTIIYTPSGTTVSQHSTKESAESALSVVETNPPSHRIVEIPDPIEVEQDLEIESVDPTSGGSI